VPVRIPEEKIQEIRDRSEIVEVVSSYLSLKRSGANHLGLCPFHAEKTPSFNVNAARQIFHCFGCGVGGNVFSFLMRMEGLSFPEAVRRLGERAGIAVEAEAPTPEELRQKEEIERLTRIAEVACDYYHQILMEAPEGAPGRRYLKARGYDGETARTFRLGYAPERWDGLAAHLDQKGFDPRWGLELGLVRPRKEGRGDYDLFRRRLLFPILDPRGRVVAFGGRVLDDSLPKYINSPESRLYHKGRLLYGLYQAKDDMRRSGEGIVVEGYFDHLALARAGFHNVVATCGTALTADHARLLKRYADRLLLLFDQDDAGRKAAFRGMEALLAEGVHPALIDLEQGEDPDSFVQKRGAEEFRRRVSEARPALEVFMDAELTAGGEGIEGRARAAQEVAARIALLPGDIEKDLYLKALAARTGVDEALLKRRMGRPEGERSDLSSPSAPRPAKRAIPAAISPRSAAVRGVRKAPGAAHKAQQWLLRLMLEDEAMRRRIAEAGTDALFLDEDHRAAAAQVLRFADQGRSLDQELICEPLSEEQRSLLAGVMLQDMGHLADMGETLFNDCRRAVEKERLRSRVRELDLLIRKAEEAGNLGECALLQGERMKINRQLKN
jgi:DNA primase